MSLMYNNVNNFKRAHHRFFFRTETAVVKNKNKKNIPIYGNKKNHHANSVQREKEKERKRV